MSLKNVHLVFVSACLALSLIVVAWAVDALGRQGGMPAVLWVIVGLASALSMAIYGWRFQRRCRQLGIR